MRQPSSSQLHISACLENALQGCLKADWTGFWGSAAPSCQALLEAEEPVQAPWSPLRALTICHCINPLGGKAYLDSPLAVLLPTCRVAPSREPSNLLPKNLPLTLSYAEHIHTYASQERGAAVMQLEFATEHSIVALVTTISLWPTHRPRLEYANNCHQATPCMPGGSTALYRRNR